MMLPCGLASNAQKGVLDRVDVFVGTGGHGHTFPHAMVPFGAVSPGPDWATTGLDAASGYHYDAKSILGFSQVHLSGSGLNELGDFLLVPSVGKIQVEPGAHDEPDKGYRSRFSHEDESASPGYYQVRLLDYDINAEMTATERTAFYQFTFPESDEAHIMLDLAHHICQEGSQVRHAYAVVKDEQTVTGYHITNGAWAPNRQLYFAMRFSKPYSSNAIYDAHGEPFNRSKKFLTDAVSRAGQHLKLIFNFATEDQEPVYVKIAVSSVSMANALENLEAEIPHWDFDKVREAAEDKWARELNKIQVQGDNDRVKKFYAALYHSHIHPTLNHDVNGEYRGIDQEIHLEKRYAHYTMFSLLNTFRATHPLFTLIQQVRTNDLIQTMVDFQRQSPMQMLPSCSLYQNENPNILGLHALPVVADAFSKGLTTVDPAVLLSAMVSSANNPGLEGRVLEPSYYDQEIDHTERDVEPGQARGMNSMEPEHSFDDWALALTASLMGEQQVKTEFLKRAQHFRKDWDPETGLCFVPHDVYGLIEMMGGNEAFVQKLDGLFQSLSSAENVSPGLYTHGNDAFHHLAYLYNYAGQPWKAQQLVHQIDQTFYKAAPDGYVGNEDAGQKSAWYVFSAMGFYPVNPAGGIYVIGSPLMKEAMLNLENGSHFRVMAWDLSEQNIYIQSVKLNGKEYTNVWLTHQEIMNGGTLEFEMGKEPGSWGVDSMPVPFADGTLPQGASKWKKINWLQR